MSFRLLRYRGHLCPLYCLDDVEYYVCHFNDFASANGINKNVTNDIAVTCKFKYIIFS